MSLGNAASNIVATIQRFKAVTIFMEFLS